MPDSIGAQLDYLRLLSQQYPSIQAASTAIISLTSQLSLPKGTEHFVSDVHGEYEALRHLLRNASGSIRRRIDELFHDPQSFRDPQSSRDPQSFRDTVSNGCTASAEGCRSSSHSRRSSARNRWTRGLCVSVRLCEIPTG